MSNLGIFNSSNYAPNQLKPSFAKTILTKYPNGNAPLFAISAAMKQGTITSHRHHWFSRVMQFPSTTVTAALPAATPGAQATVSVTDGTQFIPGAIVLVNTTDEQMLVESIVGTNAIIVRRAFGVTQALPIGVGARIDQIGNAYEEASLRPLARSFSMTELDNITQIFRNTWAVTGTVAAEQMQVGDSPVATNKREAAMFHATDMEQSIIFGEKHSSVKNGQPIRKMDGIISMIKQYAPQNVKYAASTTTMKQLSKMINPVFDVTTDSTNRNDRTIFTGNAGYAVINEIARMSGVTNFTVSETKFGLQFTTFVTDVGEVVILRHPLFNVHPEWSRMALIFDPSSSSPQYLRKTSHRAFNSDVNTDGTAEDNGIDATGGTYTTEMTMEFGAPEANGIIYGLCAAACEPCLPAPQTYSACFDVSHPCIDGAVDGGTTIFLTISNSKPSTPVTVATPSGTLDIAIDANGSGSAQYVMPTDPGHYSFAVMASPDLMNVQFSSPVQTVCVLACAPVKVDPNSPEPGACDGVTTSQQGENTTYPTDIISNGGATS